MNYSPCLAVHVVSPSASQRNVAMLLAKALAFLVISSTAASLAYEDEWRIYGGLSGGSLFGAGVVILNALFASEAKRKPIEIYALRFVINFVCGVFVGGLVMWAVLQFTPWPARPLLVGGVGFLCGMLGMAGARSLEKRLLGRLQSEREGDTDGDGRPRPRSRPEPPTDKIE